MRAPSLPANRLRPSLPSLALEGGIARRSIGCDDSTNVELVARQHKSSRRSFHACENLSHACGYVTGGAKCGVRGPRRRRAACPDELNDEIRVINWIDFHTQFAGIGVVGYVS